jgi:hypothetical protein
MTPVEARVQEIRKRMGEATDRPWLVRQVGTSSGEWLEIYIEGEYYADGSEFVVAELGIVKSKPHGKNWVATAEADKIQANAAAIIAAPEYITFLLAQLAAAERDREAAVKLLHDVRHQEVVTDAAWDSAGWWTWMRTWIKKVDALLAAQEVK